LPKGTLNCNEYVPTWASYSTFHVYHCHYKPYNVVLNKDVTYSDNLNIYITPSSGVAVATRVESPIEVSMLSLRENTMEKMDYGRKAINCGPPRSPR
jgi:hypothetical protein